jgi:hypothetical protein
VTYSEIKYSKRVRVFTEQGVAMLSSVLNSQRAILLGFFTCLIYLFARLQRRSCSLLPLQDHDEEIQAIFEAIQQLISLLENSQKKIGFTVKERKASFGKKKTQKQATQKP